MKITIREAVEVRVEGINNERIVSIRTSCGRYHEGRLASYEYLADVLEYAANALEMDKQMLVLAKQEMPSREEVISIRDNIIRISAKADSVRLPSCLSLDMIETLIGGGQVTFDMGEETLTYRMEVNPWCATLKGREYSIEHQTPDLVEYVVNFEYETIERKVK